MESNIIEIEDIDYCEELFIPPKKNPFLITKDDIIFYKIPLKQLLKIIYGSLLSSVTIYESNRDYAMKNNMPILLLPEINNYMLEMNGRFIYNFKYLFNEHENIIVTFKLYTKDDNYYYIETKKIFNCCYGRKISRILIDILHNEIKMYIEHINNKIPYILFYECFKNILYEKKDIIHKYLLNLDIGKDICSYL